RWSVSSSFLPRIPSFKYYICSIGCGDLIRVSLEGFIKIIDEGWVDVGVTDKEGNIIYVDSDSIRRNGNKVKLWNLYDFKTAQIIFGDKQYFSMRALSFP
ncbi:MAG: surface-adhesin E family protein, partial [Burkholderiales bacterium]